MIELFHVLQVGDNEQTTWLCFVPKENWASNLRKLKKIIDIHLETTEEADSQ